MVSNAKSVNCIPNEVIHEKWSSVFYQNLKLVPNNWDVQIQEFSNIKPNNKLKIFGSETMYKWMNHSEDRLKNKIKNEEKNKSRSFFIEKTANSNPLQSNYFSVHKIAERSRVPQKPAFLSEINHLTSMPNLLNRTQMNKAIITSQQLRENEIKRKAMLQRNNRPVNSSLRRAPIPKVEEKKVNELDDPEEFNLKSEIFDFGDLSDDEKFDKIDLSESPFALETKAKAKQEDEETSSKVPSIGKPQISKPKLKCKTPIHFSTDKRIQDLKTPAPSNRARLLSPIRAKSAKPKLFKKFHLDDEARNKELQALFKKLDLDDDGHLSYELVHNVLCKNFNSSHASFIKQVYNILSDSTYFGVTEFKTFISLLDVMKKQK